MTKQWFALLRVLGTSNECRAKEADRGGDDSSLILQN